MSCLRHATGARLSAFLDDELTEESALTLTRHVTDCDRCRAELEDLRFARDALRSLSDLQAPVLTSHAHAPHGVRHWSRRVAAASGLAAATLALGAAAYIVGDDDRSMLPPVEQFHMDDLARTDGDPVPVPAR